MKKLIASFCVVALGMSFTMADAGAEKSASKDLKKVVEEGPYLETAQKGITLSGYVDAGYQYNFNGRGELMTTSRRFGNGSNGDNKSRGDFDLNAIKLALEKPLSDANELQAGFRVDLMMGEDAHPLSQSDVSSDSTFLEQAYVQFRLPYGNGIDFKVGKFVSILGYEVVERPANLNITYGNIWANCLPWWHTGFLSAYKVNDNVDLQFGVVNGTNTDDGVGAKNADDDAAIIASVNFKIPEANLNWYNAIFYGINGGNMIDDGKIIAADDSPTVVYDTYINWRPKCCKEKLLLGANVNLGHAPFSTGTGAALPDYTTWWGWAAYTKYKFTDVFSLANRFDYIHNDDSHAFGNGAFPSREDIWSETVTASFDVIENMMLRVEYRLDWGKDYMTTLGHFVENVFIPGLPTDGPLHTAAVEVVYSF